MKNTGQFIIILFIILHIASCSSGDKNFSENDWKYKAESVDPGLLYAPHKEGDTYYNPWMRMKEKSFLGFLKWKIVSDPEYTEYEEGYLPKVLPDILERIKAAGDRDFILWIGHNTFLVRINNEYWLTDPIFSERALLPKRKTPPGISIKDLKKLSDKFNVIITHNHHDHLDKDTITSLPQGSQYIVPAGLKELVKGWTQGRVIELDWWQSADIGKTAGIVCLPAQHWSRRIDQGVNKSLWASYMLITPSVTIYFGGDSGYFIGYREIGKKFPGIDYALLPTTAYHPRWFMHYAHINIEEALLAFKELGAYYFIPTQWGTFRLGDNPAGYPAIELERKIKEMKLDESRFKIMDIGEILLINTKKHKNKNEVR